MGRQELTRRQRQVFDFVRSFIDDNGYPPTIREIQAHFDLKSTKGVKDHLDRLVDKGYLKRRDGSARAIEIIDTDQSPSDLQMVPVVGKVAAGVPLLAVENIVDRIGISAQIARGPGTFFLEVSGDSMSGAGIFDSDMVLVRPQPFVEQGEIAVVIVDDEATVKRFYKREGRVHLVPENDDFQTLEFGPGSGRVRVVGKVIAVLRLLDG